MTVCEWQQRVCLASVTFVHLWTKKLKKNSVFTDNQKKRLHGCLWFCDFTWGFLKSVCLCVCVLTFFESSFCLTLLSFSRIGWLFSYNQESSLPLKHRTLLWGIWTLFLNVLIHHWYINLIYLIVKWAKKGNKSNLPFCGKLFLLMIELRLVFFITFITIIQKPKKSIVFYHQSESQKEVICSYVRGTEIIKKR